MAPINPMMDANIALTPNPNTEGSKAENIRAKIPPNNPNIPPRRPKTSSRVLDVSPSNFTLPPFLLRFPLMSGQNYIWPSLLYKCIYLLCTITYILFELNIKYIFVDLK